MEYSPKQNAEEFSRVMGYHIRDAEDNWLDRLANRSSEKDFVRQILVEFESVINRAQISPFFKRKLVESFETGYMHPFTPFIGMHIPTRYDEMFLIAQVYEDKEAYGIYDPTKVKEVELDALSLYSHNDLPSLALKRMLATGIRSGTIELVDPMTGRVAWSAPVDLSKWQNAFREFYGEEAIINRELINIWWIQRKLDYPA